MTKVKKISKVSKATANRRAEVLSQLKAVTPPTNYEVIYLMLDNAELGMKDNTIGGIADKLGRPYASVYQSLRDMADAELVEFHAQEGTRQNLVRLCTNEKCEKLYSILMG